MSAHVEDAGRWRLVHGDALEALRAMPDASVDALVTDPPAGVSFMQAEWDSDKGGRDAWVAWLSTIMREALRVLKPGGHGLVWALPRTSHWTGWALEEAGFEVRDKVFHCFGSGFPKSLDVGKAIDKAAGAERPVVGKSARHGGGRCDGAAFTVPAEVPDLTAPATEAARTWDGWGTALKPAAEDWWLVRRPLDGTVAANVLQHGTGALHIDACRIPAAGGSPSIRNRETAARTGNVPGTDGTSFFETRIDPGRYCEQRRGEALGRWPAHVVLTHDPRCAAACAPECPAAVLDEQSGEQRDGVAVKSGTPVGKVTGSTFRLGNSGADAGFGGGGGASRFFATFKEGPCPGGSYTTDAGIDAGASQEAAASGSSLNRGGCGNSTTAPSRPATKCTTATATPEADQAATARHARPMPCASGAPPTASTTTPTCGPIAPLDAARFFYTAKPAKSEKNAGCDDIEPALGGGLGGTRDGSMLTGSGNERDPLAANNHPTVKPLALMRWLVRLITPPGGLVLDPFTGSGTTGVAAIEEGMRFVGCEREDRFVAIASARLARVASGVRETVDEPTQDAAAAPAKAPERVEQRGQLGLFA